MFIQKLILIIIIINFCHLRIFDSHHEFIIQYESKKFIARIINLQVNIDKSQEELIDSKYFKNGADLFGDSFSIILMEIEIISSYYYYIDLTLESLYKYNKIFKQYDTLEEAYNGVVKLFEKEKIKIYNNTDNLSIVFMMNSATCDNEEVIFKLKEKKMDKDEINEKVRIETNILTKTIKSLKEEINELKNKIRDYDIRLNYLELRDESIDTKILDAKSQLRLIKNVFEADIMFTLKYRASRNGALYNNLKLQIQNLNNILILFHTIKGLKFGAFLPKGLIYTNENNYGDTNRIKLDLYNSEYDNTNYYMNNNGYLIEKKDKFLEPKSFIFSLDLNKIFYIEKDNKIICLDKKCSFEEKIKDDCIINICSNDLLTITKNMNYIGKGFNISDYGINGREKYFNLQEIEAFQVTYQN